MRNATAGIVALTSGTALPAGATLTFGWWMPLPVVALHARALLTQKCDVHSPGTVERAIYGGAMLAAILTLYTTTRQFIYLQFLRGLGISSCKGSLLPRIRARVGMTNRSLLARKFIVSHCERSFAP